MEYKNLIFASQCSIAQSLLGKSTEIYSAGPVHLLTKSDYILNTEVADC